MDNMDNIVKRIIFQSFGYALLFFASLILNEIIIFNFCGFSDNITKNIVLRSDIDSKTIEINSDAEESDINEDDFDVINRQQNEYLLHDVKT